MTSAMDAAVAVNRASPQGVMAHETCLRRVYFGEKLLPRSGPARSMLLTESLWNGVSVPRSRLGSEVLDSWRRFTSAMGHVKCRLNRQSMKDVQ